MTLLESARSDYRTRSIPGTPADLRALVADLLDTTDEDEIVAGVYAYCAEIERLVGERDGAAEEQWSAERRRYW